MQEIHNPKRESSRPHGFREFAVEVYGHGSVRVLAKDEEDARIEAKHAPWFELDLNLEAGEAREVPEEIGGFRADGRGKKSPAAPGPADGQSAPVGSVCQSDASGRPLIKLRKEQGLDSQACAFARAKLSGKRGENMSTRAMVCVDRFGHEHFELFYRHCDGYPTALGAEIIRALLAGKSIDEVIEAVEAKEEHRTVGRPEDAFLKCQRDLEWIYALREWRGEIALEILRTSNPYSDRNFAWSVWAKYRTYMKKSDLRALAAFEKAQPLPGQPVGGSAPVQICRECGRSVAPGSGRFVNRVPDLNSAEERKAIGCPFPQGDYLCAECDAKGAEA